jgi:hypothetical protein
MTVDLFLCFHLRPAPDFNLLSYLSESLTDLPAPSISLFIPLSHSLLFASFVLTRDRPREPNEACLSDILGGPARGRMMR